jgi:hypothetical protein
MDNGTELVDNSIGTAIAMLQAKLQLKGPAIALLALGPNATHHERRMFLQRLSKIKRSDEGLESPSVPTLEKISRGFGYSTLSDFFTALGQTTLPSTATFPTKNSLQGKRGGGKVSDGKRRRAKSSELSRVRAGLFHGFGPSSSTVDLSTAPPFDERTKYVLWSIVVLLTKHLRASDAVANTRTVRDDDAPATGRRTQTGRASGRAGKNPRH